MRKLIQLLRKEDGQTVAEFAVVLIILVPLLLWTFQFFDILYTRLNLIEASRYAVWEETVNRTVTNADVQTRFFNNETDNVTIDRQNLNSYRAFNNLNTFFPTSFIANGLSWLTRSFGLNDRGIIVYTITNVHQNRFVAGLPDITMQSRYAMLTDPWKANNLTEVEGRVRTMWMGSGIIEGIIGIDVMGAINSFLSIFGINLFHVDGQLRIQ